MKNIIIIIYLISISHCTFGQVSQYSQPSDFNRVVPSVNLNLLSKTLEKVNTRIESNREQVQSLIDINLEILEDKIENGCDSKKIINFYSNFDGSFIGKKYDLNSTQDVNYLKSELRKLRNALIAFDCSEPLQINTKTESKLFQTNGLVQSFNGIVNQYCTVWNTFKILEVEANIVENLNTNTVVNITGIYKYNHATFYQIILKNGEYGYTNANNITLK